MGRGRYYTRSRKVNGRVVREYVGGGEVGRLAAQTDAIDRKQRKIERDAMRAERARSDSIDSPVNDLNEIAELLACASPGRCRLPTAQAGRVEEATWAT